MIVASQQWVFLDLNSNAMVLAQNRASAST